MASLYPNNYDDDLIIERVDNNITEIGGDTINSLRDAVFMIERAVGINPQGDKASLTDRINVSLDELGRIRSDAIEDLGLVSLPINNSHIDANAAIEETKLDLDFSTQSLKNSINSLSTDINGLQSGIAAISSSLSLHILGQDSFHDGYDIKINSEGEDQIGLTGFSGTTVGDVLVEIAAILLAGNPNQNILPHIDLGLPSNIRHQAQHISVDSSEFSIIDRTVENIQEAIDDIDAKQGAFGASHLDSFHANGILKDINSGTLFNSNQKLLGPTDGANYTEGTSVITIPGVVSFGSLGVQIGDIIEITSDVLDQGTYQIRAVGPRLSSETLGSFPSLTSNQLDVFHTFIESMAEGNNVVINIYKPASVSSQLAPLACSIKNNETISDSIAILNPNAARVVSVGFNGSIINGDGYSVSVRVGIGGGLVRELTIPDLNKERLNTNQANPVDSKSVAERINAYVSDPSLAHHFPISAFNVGNELAIAHNLVGEEYTIEIMDGYSSNFALGLDAYGANVVGNTIYGNLNNSFVVNGQELSTINTIFDGYVSINSTTDTFVLWSNSGQMINPVRLGITSGSTMHVTGHENISSNGSYTLLTATSTTVSTFATESIVAISTPTVFNVKITNSHIPLAILESGETDKGIAQLFINSSGEVFTYERLIYGTGLGSAIEVIGVSSTFPVGSSTLNVSLSGTLALFNIISDSLSGSTTTIHKDFKGIFKVYHSNNLDYLIIKTVSGTISGGVETISTKAAVPSDEALELCTFHFDGGLEITNIIDTRLFGNISSGQIREDFIETFSHIPVQELRSDGVIRGFDVLDIPFIDSVTNMQALPIQGGVAYVNGVRVSVETQRVLIQSYDSQGSLVTGTRIIGINEFGSIQVFTDELGEILTDGYDSSAAYGRILPLYQVLVTAGFIISYVDLRLFINDLDSKLELIVDGTNNFIGNFRSLEGALLYASSYPNKEHLTIKIINSISVSTTIVVPDGISILGSSLWGGDGKQRIVNTANLGTAFITLNGNNRIENIEIVSEVSAINGALIYVNGPNVSVKNCMLYFGQSVSTTDADVGILIGPDANKNVIISNNKINMVYSGIVGLYGCDNVVIEKNIITNISGTNGISNGIKIGNSTRILYNIFIAQNHISVPSVVSPADIRGISIDIGQSIENVRIVDNYILHEANNTVTNGIRVENESSTGNQISNLIINNNIIDGVKLDDNDIWGLYVSSTNSVKINNNIITNVGVSSGNTDVGCIGVATDVDFAEINGNTLKSCDVTRGIEITSGTRANIFNNILDTLGTSAYYISGNAPHSSISNNALVGPGDYGIRWTGTNSKISDNNLSQPADLSDYAFESYGIFVQTSDTDITNNTINGMVFDQESIGISNVSTGRNRIKIIGNTIYGSKMNSGIELFGDGHVVSNNRILNTAAALTNITSLISLNEVENALIMGNLLQGDAYSGISASVSLINTTIANNVLDPTLGAVQTMSYALNIEFSTNCFISGNKLPTFGQGITFDSVIGNATAINYSENYNTIDVNVGLKDMRNIHASQAMTSYDSTSDVPHWVMNDNNGYWELFSTSSLTRNLYFPIHSLPNGAKLLSVQAIGSYNLQGTLTIQAFKKSRTDLVSEAISAADTITTNGSFGTISNSDGLVNISLSSGEVINYYNHNYYVVITHTGGAAAPTNIQIHGLTITFRY